jgi:hypothetical protein
LNSFHAKELRVLKNINAKARQGFGVAGKGKKLMPCKYEGRIGKLVTKKAVGTDGL